MSMLMIARVLWLRRTLRARERWDRSQLLEHQRRELATLRVFAAARSPFYRRSTLDSTTPRSAHCRY